MKLFNRFKSLSPILTYASLLSVTLASSMFLTTACTSSLPAVSSPNNALPLRRVVVYRNGVAYFERNGQIETSKVRFRVRGDEVGDFLATLAVIEQGGNSVRSASFPLKVEEPDEEHDGDPDEIKISKQKHSKEGKNKLVDVVLTLDGQRHALQVGYVAETPVWRPSYRLVVHKDGTADLQAWGIVQNLSGEDWRDVQLSLVAGAPLAFQPTLGTPVIPTRPIITDMGEVIEAIPTSETSLNEGAPPPASPSPAPMASMMAPSEIQLEESGKDEAQAAPRYTINNPIKQKEMDAKLNRFLAPRTRAGSLRGAFGKEKILSADKPRPDLSPPRSLSQLAAVAIEGSSTRYDIPVPITVPNKSATMVLLLSKRVIGESIFLFAPSAGVTTSHSHPFRVARFTNQTSGLLERGPIAVFEDGAFLGQGMVDPLPPNAVTTVPFALERSIAVENSTEYGEEGARLASIEASELHIERDTWTKTKYKIKNGGDELAKLLVKHTRRVGTRLHQPPKGTEENTGTGSALVPTEIRAHDKSELVVDERSASVRHVDWLSDLADDAIKAYLGDSRADAIVAAQLRAAWAIRPELIRRTRDEQRLQHEQNELSKSTEETRRNLKVLEKNTVAAALRAQLTSQLAKASARLDEITKQLVETRLALDTARVKFQEAIRVIKMTKPLPPQP